MRIALTTFAIDHHWDSKFAGTTITDRTPIEFENEISQYTVLWPYDFHLHWQDGYAPFCKLLFVTNFTNANTGSLPITPENEHCLRSGYKARSDEELPVLTRWFEGLPEVPEAEYLVLVLYDKKQLAKGRSFR